MTATTCRAENVLGAGPGDGWWVTCDLPSGHDGDHEDFHGNASWSRGTGSDTGSEGVQR